MSFISKIYLRSNTRELTNYLLHGASSGEAGKANYYAKLKKAYQCYEEILPEKDEESVLHNAVNQLISATENAYMEIGFRAGFLLAKDIFDGISDEACKNSSAENGC